MSPEQKRAITAVVISGLILFGWQYFFAPPVVQTATVTKTETKNVSLNDQSKPETLSSVSDAVVVESQSIEINNEKITYTIDSNLTVKEVTSEQTHEKLTDLFKLQKNNKVLFNFDGSFKTLNFTFAQISNSEFEINNAENDLKGKLFVDDKGFLQLSLVSSKNFNYRFEFNAQEEELEGGKYKQFIYASDSFETIRVGDDEKGDAEMKWFGLDFRYHIFTILLDKKPLVFEATENGKFLLQDTKSVNSLNLRFVFAKKEYDHLIDLGDKLELSVDFSFWSILAVPILRGLQFFYSLIPNWGISIIILTILMRMLTFPLQYKSFKSMKKMQEIQPELTKIREKFKSDPQKMQTETMALFKKAGTNPLGGCLPMILQMPIFFAFYRVLFSSVELVEAPFYFWITDLSLKDPYYVLPVLMGVAMFFHQRLTPTTTMDPTQKKIMMFMPLIFAVFMKDFPAGLTLYIVVSTFVAMLQQIFVYKRT